MEQLKKEIQAISRRITKVEIITEHTHIEQGSGEVIASVHYRPNWFITSLTPKEDNIRSFKGTPDALKVEIAEYFNGNKPK